MPPHRDTCVAKDSHAHRFVRFPGIRSSQRNASVVGACEVEFILAFQPSARIHQIQMILCCSSGISPTRRAFRNAATAGLRTNLTQQILYQG